MDHAHASHRFTFSDGFMEMFEVSFIDVIRDLTVAASVMAFGPSGLGVCCRLYAADSGLCVL